MLPSVAALSNNDHTNLVTDMEVADQWRREWAGTAEYGKVTEGGVTRRIARAMEVLHASGPGARVRVMRAAYHSTAGPGAPAESFMLHSSRRVISSGFNFLEAPSPHTSTKPLEISSTPLELSREFNAEPENYKVTEPDDLEISEPSKWKSSTRGRSMRMPSEESSSTDNASIIDLDSKSSKSLHRKYSYDSDNSDIQLRSKSNSITSQHLDVPTVLSTLKYKSLLNNSNEWNTRRKSYSFEDTSPLNEAVTHKLAMESSTDSGICKSTEIMDDHIDDNSDTNYSNLERAHNKEESFRDWLAKNRQNSQYKGTKFKTYREHEIVLEDTKENNIILQSPGKVSITLPVTIETNNVNTRKAQMSEDIERRVKKVEFCKTEVHFAAESGKVNIIATDDKPPPSNDFRKRRSAFVPMQDIIDKPITLLGEKNGFTLANGIGPTWSPSNVTDIGESDENTAATKSILKNKIPKPKPYLLGENMEFGPCGDVSHKNSNDSVKTAISIINQQLNSDKSYIGENKSMFSRVVENNIINNNVLRTVNAGPNKNYNLTSHKPVVTNIKIEKPKPEPSEDTKNKFSSLRTSPIPALKEDNLVKPKTRQLRESDLTYFGIDSDRKPILEEPFESKSTNDNLLENIFQSVKLIQQISSSVSNSVCNSEPESEEAPEYQNLPMNINYAPIPTPRMRSKYETNEINQVRAALRPIAEKENEETKDNLKSYSRRHKVRRQEEVKASRSLSEPPKNFKCSSLKKLYRREDQPLSSRKMQPMEEKSKQELKEITFIDDRSSSEDNFPLYANLNNVAEITGPNMTSTREKPNKHSPQQRLKHSCNKEKQNTLLSNFQYEESKKEQRYDSGTDSNQRNRHSVNKHTVSSSLKREIKQTSAGKALKPASNTETTKNTKEEINKNKIYSNREEINAEKKGRSSRALQRSLVRNTSEEHRNGSNDYSAKNRDASSHRKRNSSKDKVNSLRENIKSSKLSPDSSPRRLSAQTKGSDRDNEVGSKSNNYKSDKHREYVINYDDKNGTVSSICKITPGHGAPRRKRTSKVVLKENNKDNELKTKPIDKIALRK